jgi:hypothetical protein
MKAILLTAALAAALGAVHPLHAQNQAAAGGRGITLTGGAGVGWTRPACSYCRRSLNAGPVVYLDATGQVNPRLALGAQANLWAHDEQAFVLMGMLGLVAQLYPNPEGPLFLRAGLGYLTYRAYDDDQDLVSNAPAINLGIGYRFQFSSGIAITNFANMLTSRFGKLRSDDAVLVDNMGVTSLQLGIALSRD